MLALFQVACLGLLVIGPWQLAGLRLAFLGDQGIGTHPKAVLGLVRDFSPDGVLLLGDFDYKGMSAIVQ